MWIHFLFRYLFYYISRTRIACSSLKVK